MAAIIKKADPINFKVGNKYFFYISERTLHAITYLDKVIDYSGTWWSFDGGDKIYRFSAYDDDIPFFIIVEEQPKRKS